MASAGWWRDGDALARFLIDLIATEARHLRPNTMPAQPSQSWQAETRLGEGGLGFDSLERLHLATAVSEALHMHESGLADYFLVRPTIAEWCAIAAASLDRFSHRLTVRTSGSSGVPKPCIHEMADLELEVDMLATCLAGGTRVLTTVPCHHIYGFLTTVLLPRRLGVPVRDIRDHSAGGLGSLLRPGDIVIGYPDYWAAALRGLPSGWPEHVTGVTSTAPCPAEIADRLALAGLSRLIEIHGTSETAGIGWRDDPRAPYTLMPQWTPGPDLGLIRAAGNIQIACPDRMAWCDRNTYHLGARHDGAVQVAGINVFPAQVRDALREHPGVADAAVRLMTPVEGERLKAFIVPSGAADDFRSLQDELAALAAARLSTPEQPRAYTFGARIPTNPMGKAADWAIGSGAPDRGSIV